jgi:glycosyltransferase involved in cell wall biosynthesis
VLFLGTLEPRKNLVHLVDAFAAWRKTSGQRVKLVIAGGKGWYYQQVFARVQELAMADDVIFPGFVPADELPWWYRAAECFVYPSLFEGFGLPVLEAMACGTPTITSSTSSLPEVGGDAALLVDAESVAALAGGLDRVIGDKEVAAGMRERGLRQAAHFSWARTAAETTRVYREVLEGHREE